MTCIVGIEIPGVGVLMGADSCASDGYKSYKITDSKLFIKNGVSFGYTTSFRFADILKHHVVIPDNTTGLSDSEFLIKEVVFEIREKLKEHGYSKIANNNEIGGEALIGYRGKLYELQSDYSLMGYTHGYGSCGSGMYYALGSLYTTKNSKISDKDRLTWALMAAAEYSPGVSPPFTFLMNEST